jgi:hypothetical protein
VAYTFLTLSIHKVLTLSIPQSSNTLWLCEVLTLSGLRGSNTLWVRHRLTLSGSDIVSLSMAFISVRKLGVLSLYKGVYFLGLASIGVSLNG